MAGRRDAAIGDLMKSLGLAPKDMYTAMWVYIADAHGGKDAKAELAALTQGWDLSAWPGPLVAVLRGDMKPDAIVMPTHTESWGAARDACERDFYLGEKALFDGDKARAAELFRAARDTHITEYIEYAAAVAELGAPANSH